MDVEERLMPENGMELILGIVDVLAEWEKSHLDHPWIMRQCFSLYALEAVVHYIRTSIVGSDEAMDDCSELFKMTSKSAERLGDLITQAVAIPPDQAKGSQNESNGTAT